MDLELKGQRRGCGAGADPTARGPPGGKPSPETGKSGDPHGGSERKRNRWRVSGGSFMGGEGADMEKTPSARQGKHNPLSF